MIQLSLTNLGRDKADRASNVVERLLMSGLLGLPKDQLRCVETGMRLMVKLLNAERTELKPLH